MKRRSLKQVLVDALKLFLNDIKSVKWAIVIIIAYFAFGRLILHSMCAMVVITGFPCPGCGLTRAGRAVLRFDFTEAWKIHPFIYPIMLLVIAYVFGRYILRKKEMPAVSWCLIVVLAVMILFYVWRMWKYFPGEPPMSYYEQNLFHRLAVLLKMIG